MKLQRQLISQSLNEINKYFLLVHDEIKIYGIVHVIWFDYMEEVVCQYTLVHILSWQYLIDPILYDCILVLLKRWHNKCKNSNIRNKLYNCNNLLSFQCCYSLRNWWLHVLVHIFVHSWSCFTQIFFCASIWNSGKFKWTRFMLIRIC